MKRSIRFFAIGLFTSTILLFGYYFFFEPEDSLETVATEELIATIEDEGYRVITEDEFITFSLMNEQEKTDEVEKDDDKKEDKKKTDHAKEDKADEKDDDEKVKEPKTITFTTEDGVVSQDVADTLIENNIINDRQKFLDYLDDNDYSGYIQVGKFKVSDDMSFKELAEIVTTYPGD